MSEAPKAAAPEMLSVVIPAYNEQDVLADTVRALAQHLDGCGFGYEIVVVDDGSRDRTAEVIRELETENPRLRGVTNPGPHGYGCAVRCGLSSYAGDAVAIVMADGSDRPADVEAYYRKILEGWDMAFGTRFAPGTRVEGYPRFKLLLNRLGNALIGRLVGRSYNDFTNGFKCYRREVIDAIQPLVSGQFNLTVEMSIKAVQTGARFAVVPNDWAQRDAGESKFNLLGLSWLYLLTILYCLVGHHLRGAVSRPASAPEGLGS